MRKFWPALLIAFCFLINFGVFRIGAGENNGADNQIAVLNKSTALHLIKGTVRVKPAMNANESGSGSVIYCSKRSKESNDSKYYSYILTCHHVVGDSPTAYVEKFIYPHNQKIEVIIGYTGEVVLQDTKQDLALIEVISDFPFDDVIAIATDKDIEALTLYDSAYMVGCALADPPYITNGNISNFNYEDKYYQTSATTIFGDSGGAICLASGKLLGVATVVRGYRDPFKIVHPHPCSTLSTPAPTIRKWFTESNFGFLITSDQGTLDDSLQLRKKLKEEAEKEALEKAKLKAAREAREKALKEAQKKIEKEKKDAEKEKLNHPNK
jgi:hypothetical protein